MERGLIFLEWKCDFTTGKIKNGGLWKLKAERADFIDFLETNCITKVNFPVIVDEELDIYKIWVFNVANKKELGRILEKINVGKEKLSWLKELEGGLEKLRDELEKVLFREKGYKRVWIDVLKSNYFEELEMELILGFELTDIGLHKILTGMSWNLAFLIGFVSAIFENLGLEVREDLEEFAFTGVLKDGYLKRAHDEKKAELLKKLPECRKIEERRFISLLTYFTKTYEWTVRKGVKLNFLLEWIGKFLVKFERNELFILLRSKERKSVNPSIVQKKPVGVYFGGDGDKKVGMNAYVPPDGFPEENVKIYRFESGDALHESCLKNFPKYFNELSELIKGILGNNRVQTVHLMLGVDGAVYLGGWFVAGLWKELHGVNSALMVKYKTELVVHLLNYVSSNDKYEIVLTFCRDR